MTTQAPVEQMSRRDLDSMLANHPAVDSFPRRNLYGRLGIHPMRLSTKSLPMEARVFAKSLWSSNAPKPFVLYGRPRSGTTLVVKLLNQLPGVTCDGELLNGFLFSPVGLMSRLPKRARPGVKAYGMKILSYQLMEIQRVHHPLAFFDSLASRGYSVIHFTRNTWDQTLSLLKAHESGVYFSKSLNGSQTLRLDPERFFELLKWNEGMLEYEKAVMAHVDHFSLSYDRDLKESTQHQKTIDALSTFLGTASAPVNATMKRTGGDRGLQKVENLDEVIEHVRQTELAHLVP